VLVTLKQYLNSKRCLEYGIDIKKTKGGEKDIMERKKKWQGYWRSS
jgi:hypothetical protein